MMNESLGKAQCNAITKRSLGECISKALLHSQGFARRSRLVAIGVFAGFARFARFAD